MNVVSRVRYDIRSAVGKPRPTTSRSARHGGAVTGDNGRTELVRVELDENDLELPGTLELIAEYAVDLKFGISVATEGTVPGVTNPQITRYPITAIDNDAAYRTAAANDSVKHRPGRSACGRSRSGFRLRTWAPDRDVGFPVLGARWPQAPGS